MPIFVISAQKDLIAVLCDPEFKFEASEKTTIKLGKKEHKYEIKFITENKDSKEIIGVEVEITKTYSDNFWGRMCKHADKVAKFLGIDTKHKLEVSLNQYDVKNLLTMRISGHATTEKLISELGVKWGIKNSFISEQIGKLNPPCMIPGEEESPHVSKIKTAIKV